MHRRRLVLVATILGSSIAFLDVMVVNVALPTIERELDLGLAGEQWIFAGYSVTLAALYLPAGALGDRYGYVNTFVVGVGGFAAASALAGAAPDGGVLVAARVVQGVFGALLTPSSLALLRATYADEAGRAIGSWSAWTGISTALGPPLGGVIVDALSWRWIFFLNLPLAAATIALALASRDTCRTDRHPRHLDVPGVLLAASGMGALVWALVEGPRAGFTSVSSLTGFAVAAAALGAFFVVEARAREPMLPLSLFRIRELAVANLATFFVYASLVGVFFFFVLFAQSVLGYSAPKAGLLLTPISLMLLLLAARLGRAADLLGARWFLVGGPALIGVGLLFLGRLHAGSDFWREGFPPLMVFSFGLAATVAPVTAAALKPAPEGFSGIASGVNTTVSRLGQLLAVAVLGIVASLVYDSGEGNPFELGTRGAAELSRAADAFQAAMWTAAGLAFAGALVSGLGLRTAAPEPARTEASEPAPDTAAAPPPASPHTR